MLLTTTELVIGREYDILGLVKGATIQSKNIGKDFGAGLKSIVGGELKGYTEMMEEARDIAMQRMENCVRCTAVWVLWQYGEIIACFVLP